MHMLQQIFQKKIHDLNLSNLVSEESLLQLLDLTCLNESALEHDISNLINIATKQKVAAICVLPKHAKLVYENTLINTASVVNFPTGDENHTNVLKQVECLLPYIDEIDYVFAYQQYLNGDKNGALSKCNDVYKICQQQNKIFKVIIESGVLPSLESIYEISYNILQQGCDFIKTSTGKTKGANIEAVFAILSAIINSKSNCGIKISGGIKSIQQASPFINIARNMLNKDANAQWLRIGTSTTIWS